MRTRLPTLVVLVLALAIVVAACSSADDAPASDDQPPTDAALAENTSFVTPPPGTEDCGAVVLSSGWPTTTVFVAEDAGACILEAAADGTAAHQAYWQRDNQGGILGTVITVEGPGAIVETTYAIDGDGQVDSSDQACSTLDVPDIGPPRCAAG